MNLMFLIVGVFLLYLILLGGILLLARPLGKKLLFSNGLPTILIYSATYFQFVVCSVLCLFDLKSYERKLKSAYSSIKASKLPWLFFMVSGYVVIWLTAYVNYLCLQSFRDHSLGNHHSSGVHLCERNRIQGPETALIVFRHFKRHRGFEICHVSAVR